MIIVHGKLYRVIPVEDAYRIASRILGNQLTIVPTAGHVMTTDQPELCIEAMQSFLSRA